MSSRQSSTASQAQSRSQPRSLAADTRGVNTVVGYVLALSITTILISLLILTTTGFVQTQQRSVINTEMQIVGQQVAATFMDLDRAVRAQNTTGELSRSLSEPPKLGGAFYSINTSNVSGRPNTYAVTLRTDSPPVEWRVVFKSKTPVETDTVAGGNIVIAYDAERDMLVIQNA